MRAPAFWRGPERSIAALLLSPIGAIYGAIAGARLRRPGARVAARVICIGNFTAGGAGKTPTALAVAELLRDMGESPAFLSRGYGGALSTRAPLRVDPVLHRAADVGDEPLLLARAAPTFICADRLAGAQAAASYGASAIVMDDGLQNPSLVKDLSLAVVDGATGLGNGLTLPAGPLRAPMAAQWAQVQAVLVVGPGAAGEALAEDATRRGLAVLRAVLAPDDEVCATLRGQRLLAFAGIGRPEKFFDTLRACGADLVATRAFADHHPFTESEIAALADEARRLDARLATTEKDAARLGARARDALVLPVRMRLENVEALRGLLSRG